MKTIKQSYLINAPMEKVWQALVDPKEIEKWGAGPAKMDSKVGTKFSLWDGDIHGKNIEVIHSPAGRYKLVQDWYGGDWPQPSKVTFTLSQKNNQTQVELLHENVPDKEESGIADGWNSYYLREIKKYLENQ